MSRPFCWAAVALIGLITTAVTHAATTNAVIPYKAMDDLWQIASSADQSKLMVRVFVASTNKTVRPADIVLTIQSASAGKIPVQLSTNGQIIDFPHRTELVRENPSIVANQPRGTLNLFIGYKIPVEGLSFPYSRLGHAAAEANKMIKSQGDDRHARRKSAGRGVCLPQEKFRAGKGDHPHGCGTQGVHCRQGRAGETQTGRIAFVRES